MNSPLKVCILDNDNLDPAVVDTYVSYGAMTEKMFAAAGVPWQFERFNTTRGEYPDSFDAYDAVLLTGSKADSFSDEPWVRDAARARHRAAEAAQEAAGHLLRPPAHRAVPGRQVGRAPQGWGMGRMTTTGCGPRR
jgi:GMP synthase-like glutamine amidotransferase